MARKATSKTRSQQWADRRLGRLIRDRRKHRRIPQTELAVVAGVTQPAMSKIERGEILPSPPVLERITLQLGLAPEDVDRLLTIDGRTGIERQDPDDYLATLAHVFRCGRCGSSVATTHMRAVVDVLSELRLVAVVAARSDVDAESDLAKGILSGLDSLQTLLDVG